MKLPVLKHVRREERTVKAFGGIDRRVGSGEGSFVNMLNISHGSLNTLMSRASRGIMNFGDDTVYNMTALDILRGGSVISKAFVVYNGRALHGYYNDGGAFLSHHLTQTSSFLAEGHKQTVLSGTKLFFFPDGAYVNLLDLDDKKKLGLSQVRPLGAADGYYYELCLTRCDSEGNDDSENGEYGRLECRCYSLKADGTKGSYMQRMAVNAGFLQGDTVEIKGFSDKSLEGYYSICGIDAGRQYVIIECPHNDVSNAGNYVMRRRIPVMDYVTSCGDRLWGCRYGVDEDGNSVNAIYASAEGDASNWYRLDGKSGSSWRADVGSAGEFTGAVCYGGRPVFFKEGAIIKVYGSKPSDFSLSETSAPGVESGSSESIAALGNELYYKSCNGIVRYDGSLPRAVDEALGGENFKNAVAGSIGSKYYVSMENRSGERQLYVYDADSRIWHEEDDPGVRAFCRCSSELFMLCSKDGKSTVYSVGGTYNSDAENAGSKEEPPVWMLESANIGFDTPEHKYVSKVILRMELDPGASAALQTAYDGDNVWHTERILHRARDGIINVSVCPRRCSYFRIKLSGSGGMRLYSVTRVLEKCSSYHRGRV